MGEDRPAEGGSAGARLRELLAEWVHGRVTLKDVVCLSEEELHGIAAHGYFLFLQGKIEAARVVFEGLVAVDSASAYPYRALGAIYWRLGEPEKALEHLGYAIRLAPGEAASYVSRAEIRVALGERERAREDLLAIRRTAGPLDRALVEKADAMLRLLGREG